MSDDCGSGGRMPSLRGCGTALVTPFLSGGAIDEKGVVALARRQVDAGAHFLVPCGTTGESATLASAEKVRIAELVVEAADGRVPVIAGCGGSDTAEVIDLAGEIEATGADGLLVVTPFYNKPTPDGLFAHYGALAEATALPIVVYNVPSRTGVNVSPATLARLASIPGVEGVKEAAGDIMQMGRVVKAAPEGFAVLSGDDAAALPAMALGAQGLISVVSNQIPGPMAKLCDLCLAGDFPAARELHNRWLELMEANFCETNPGPVKYSMYEMGLLELRYRLPLAPITEASRGRVLDAMRAAGLFVAAAGA